MSLRYVELKRCSHIRASSSSHTCLSRLRTTPLKLGNRSAHSVLIGFQRGEEISIGSSGWESVRCSSVSRQRWSVSFSLTREANSWLRASSRNPTSSDQLLKASWSGLTSEGVGKVFPDFVFRN